MKTGKKLLSVILSALILMSCMSAFSAGAVDVKPAAVVAQAEAYPESPHPYASDCEETWNYTSPLPCAYLAITFDEKTNISYFDELVIYNEEGTAIYSFCEDYLAGETIYIKGSSFSAVLKGYDYDDAEYYGFKITSIEPLLALPEDRYVLESTHPYESEEITTYEYTHPTDAQYLAIKFSPENFNYLSTNYLKIFDENGRLVYDLSVNNLYCTLLLIEGNSFKIELGASSLIPEYGFSIISVREKTDVIPVDEIELEAMNSEIFVDSFTFVDCYTYPEDATWPYVIYSSSDESVATVDQDGFVKAVSAGTVTITATSIIGNATSSVDIKVKNYTILDYILMYLEELLSYIDIFGIFTPVI